jgi:hypothetical protein
MTIFKPDTHIRIADSAFTGSLWSASSDAIKVFFTMLWMADKATGMVVATVGGIARLTKMSIEAARKALEELASPDADSSNPGHEGRRIERVERGRLSSTTWSIKKS